MGMILRPDLTKVMLGKQPRIDDPRTLQIQKYTGAVAAPPPGWGWAMRTGIKQWGMYLNGPNNFSDPSLTPDELNYIRRGLGCCAIAAPIHGIQLWTANARKELSLPDSVDLEYYEKWCGFNPANAATDQGGNMLPILRNWRKQGLAGQSLDAFAAIHLPARAGHGNKFGIVTPIIDLMRAVWMFGGAYVGVQLPLSSQSPYLWDMPDDPGPADQPGSWGGHAVWMVSYSATKVTFITWGYLQEATWRWLQACMDEAYACVSQDFIKASGVSPLGLSLAAMDTDVASVTQ